jgi:hypothetical protein
MGVQEGDVITRINGEAVEDFGALAERIAAMEPGGPVTLDLMRGAEPLTLQGELGSKEERSIMRFAFPPDAPMPPEGHPFSFRGMPAPEEMDLRREMEELRREMQELRREMGGTITREMRVVIDTYTLSKEESELLRSKGVTALDNALDLPDLRLFPNPGDGFFRIAFEAPERGDLNVDVHDATGERVYHETISGFKGRYERTLDLSDRANGAYFLVITQHGRALARKLVKQ